MKIQAINNMKVKAMSLRTVGRPVAVGTAWSLIVSRERARILHDAQYAKTDIQAEDGFIPYDNTMIRHNAESAEDGGTT